MNKFSLTEILKGFPKSDEAENDPFITALAKGNVKVTDLFKDSNSVTEVLNDSDSHGDWEYCIELLTCNDKNVDSFFTITFETFKYSHLKMLEIYLESRWVDVFYINEQAQKDHAGLVFWLKGFRASHYCKCHKHLYTVSRCLLEHTIASEFVSTNNFYPGAILFVIDAIILGLSPHDYEHNMLVER